MFLLIFVIALGTFIYYNLIKPSRFWDDYNVTRLSSWPVAGSMLDAILRRKSFPEVVHDLYRKYPNERYSGYMQFQTPVLMVRDLELIKQVGIKEFEHFHDHTRFAAHEQDPILSKSLIILQGDKWKQMRATLSPAFTSSKMKNMYSLIWGCAESFVKHFENQKVATVEMKDIFTRFSNDVIASVAFGIQVDSMKEPDNEFYTMGKSLISFSAVKALQVFMFQTSSWLTKVFRVRLFDEKVENFFCSIIKNNINKRKAENIVRHDLIHLLMQAQKGQLKHEGLDDKNAGFATVEESDIGKAAKQMILTDDYIMAQALVFFFGGFDPVSTNLSFMAYELAVNPEVQKKLQEEIDFVANKFNGNVSYETLLSMKYLDQVVSETMRLWPANFMSERVCTRDFIINPENPNETTLHLKKGTSVVIPVMALQRDAKYFPNPEVFDPERFNEENKINIVNGSYLPFGIGPRNCIGSRLALLETKTMFFNLLLKFDIVVTEKTVIPVEPSKSKPTLLPDGGITLSFKLRKQH